MANETTTIINDQKGRALEVKRPTRRDAMRLMRGWGTACNVEMWVGQAMLAVTCRSIDGVPIPLPTTADQAESLVDRLEDEGLNAIAEWLAEQNAAAPTPAEEIAAAKN